MDWRSIDLNLLVIFDAIGRERNLTRASVRLGMSQSAVSHALTRLRKVLNDDLFLKSADGMTPTAHASTLIEPIRTALDLFQAAITPAGFDPLTARNTFKIAMDNKSALVLVAPLATLITETAPNVSLDIRPTGLLDIVDALDRGGLDITISCIEDIGDRLSSRFLFDDEFSVLSRADHPISQSDIITLEQLAAFPHLSVSSICEDDRFVDDTLAIHGLTRHVALRAPLHSAMSILVESDMLAVVGTMTARAFVRSETLRVLGLPFAAPRTKTNMFWHRRWDKTPSHQWLREAIAGVRI